MQCAGSYSDTRCWWWLSCAVDFCWWAVCLAWLQPTSTARLCSQVCSVCCQYWSFSSRLWCRCISQQGTFIYLGLMSALYDDFTVYNASCLYCKDFEISSYFVYFNVNVELLFVIVTWISALCKLEFCIFCTGWTDWWLDVARNTTICPGVGFHCQHILVIFWQLTVHVIVCWYVYQPSQWLWIYIL